MSDAAYIEDEPLDAEVLEFTAGAGSGVGRLQKALAASGDVTGHLDAAKLAEIGTSVVDDWRRDQELNKEWRERAEEAIKAAAQEKPEPKDYPFQGAANVKYPLLTIANLQFAARAYPAIVKGDEAVKVKTFGRDPQGKKQARAKRVADYLNYLLFYSVEGWEEDTDSMLHRLPAVGQHFRKVWWDPLEQRCCIESVSALRLTVPPDATSLKSAPRITHDFDQYPYQISQLIAQGYYREVTLTQESEDEQAPRIILEQHRLMDLDEDGLEEPYVVTVDSSTTQVLRIEEAFGEEDVTEAGDGQVLAIRRWMPFVSYPFIPDPKGRAYGLGFGQLLAPILAVVNSTINMTLDAGHAQVAGGGFVAQEVRLQGGGRNGVLRWQPGEYKTVSASGTELRNAIYERTFPNPSTVLFQLLGMLMDAAKDIASVNEAITGDAARTAPVGTTLALIEQGQQVFNAIYKRIYRALREEFRLFANCVRRYGDPEEYARFCDVEPEQMGHNGGPPMEGAMGVLPPSAPPMNPQALFEADFDEQDLDIRPVSDPSVVTRAQMMAKAQFELSLIGTGVVNPAEVVKGAMEAAQSENIEAKMTLPPPPPPNPELLAKVEEIMARVMREQSTAQLNTAKAAEIANNNSGAQADANLAEQASRTMVNQAKAAQTAASLLPVEQPLVEPES